MIDIPPPKGYKKHVLYQDETKEVSLLEKQRPKWPKTLLVIIIIGFALYKCGIIEIRHGDEAIIYLQQQQQQ